MVYTFRFRSRPVRFNAGYVVLAKQISSNLVLDAERWALTVVAYYPGGERSEEYPPHKTSRDLFTKTKALQSIQLLPWWPW